MGAKIICSVHRFGISSQMAVIGERGPSSWEYPS